MTTTVPSLNDHKKQLQVNAETAASIAEIKTALAEIGGIVAELREEVERMAKYIGTARDPKAEVQPLMSNQTFDIDESYGLNAVVGTPVLINAAAYYPRALTWSIASGNTNDTFAINPTTGEITVADPSQLDNGARPSYSLVVRVDNGYIAAGGGVTEATITVTVANVVTDVAPTIGNYTFNIDDLNYTTGAVVGSVAPSNVPVPSTVTYSITAGNALGIFGIDSATGVISIADDTNLIGSGASTINLTVTISNGVSPDDTGTVAMVIADETADLAPAISNQSFGIVDNATVGQTLGTVPLDNVPVPSALTWSITAGNTGTAFAIDSNGRITVAATLNAGVTASYSLTIRAENSAGFDTCTVSVTVTAASATSDITTFTLKSTDGANIPANTIFELALPLKPGDLVSGQRIRMVDAGASVLTVQEDNRNTDEKGSIRHTYVTGKLANAPGAPSTVITIQRETGEPVTGTPLTVQNILDETANDGFDCLLTFTFPDGTIGTASARDALQGASDFSLTAEQLRGTWREAGLCAEYICWTPVFVSGVAHGQLHVEFHIPFFKTSTGAWNIATNPITGAFIEYFINNGYAQSATAADYVYDLKVEVGYNVRTQAKQAGTTNDLLLNGSSGDVTVTLGGSGTGSGVTVTRASGSWAAVSMVPNDSIVGKALVQVSGPGRGMITKRDSNTVLRATIPTLTAFTTGLTVTQTNWRTMGVYHYHSARLTGQCWWGTQQKVNAILTTSYLKASQMIPNLAATEVSVPSLSTTSITREGGHPFGMEISGNGRLGGFPSTIEDGIDTQGFLTPGQAQALVQWGNTTNHADARVLMFGEARSDDVRPFWIWDGEFGGQIGIDDAGIYKLANRTSDTGPVLSEYRGGSPWYTLWLNHTWDASFFPFILTGRLRYLQGVLRNAITYHQRATDNARALEYSCSISGTTITVSAGHPFQTGETVNIRFTGKPKIDGVDILTTNRYFARRLSATQIEVYDTYANAINTASTFGRKTFTAGGTSTRLVNGYGKHGLWDTQTRQIAWGVRSLSRPWICLPDSVDEKVLGRMWTKANAKRAYDVLTGVHKAAYVDDPSFQAGGPRFFARVGSVWTSPPWQVAYVQFAFNFALECMYGFDDTTSVTADIVDWHCESPIKMITDPDSYPLGLFGDNYTKIRLYNGTTNPVVYDWETMADNIIVRAPLDNAHWAPTGVTVDVIGPLGASGTGATVSGTTVTLPGGTDLSDITVGGATVPTIYLAQATQTIKSFVITAVDNVAKTVTVAVAPTGVTSSAFGIILDQKNVEVQFKKAGVEWTFFDMTNATTRDKHLGTWIGVGGTSSSTAPRGKIKSISAKGTCVIDCTVAAGDELTSGASQYAITGTGLVLSVPYPSKGNAAAVFGTQKNWNTGGSNGYMADMRSQIEICKQRGIYAGEYAAAIAFTQSLGMPSSPPSPTAVNQSYTMLRFNFLSRVA